VDEVTPLWLSNVYAPPLPLGPQAARDVVVDDAQGARCARPLGHTRSLGRRCVQCQRTIVEGSGPVAQGSVVVVGGTRGIGRQLASVYAGRGRDVVLTGRDEARAQAV